MHFYKYQGTGNDFIIIDNRGQNLHQTLTTQSIAAMCDRRFGIGADGLMLLTDKEGYDFQMIYYNADGRESSMCGNGGRCITAFAQKMGIEKEKYHFLAIDGEHEAIISENSKVKLKMTRPTGFHLYNSNEFWLNTGSPHYVILAENEVDSLDMVAIGRNIRYNAEFSAEGTNVNIVNILEKGKLKVRTYERGVEDETLSCGTGVTACAYSYVIWNNRIEKVEVATKGGNLSVEVKDFDQETEEVWLVGAATFVFDGDISLIKAAF